MATHLSHGLEAGICLAVVLSVGLARPAFAETVAQYVAPHIGGHVTDPGAKITGAEKDEIESLFGGIQADTKVDVAAFIAPVSRDEVEAAGQGAYKQWGIGRSWETGVLLTMSDNGQGCRLIVPTEGSPLTPSAVSEIETAVAPIARDGHFAEALRVAGDRLGKLLRARAKVPLARPWGARDLPGSAKYGAGVLLSLVLAAALSFRGRKTWRAA